MQPKAVKHIHNTHTHTREAMHETSPSQITSLPQGDSDAFAATVEKTLKGNSYMENIFARERKNEPGNQHWSLSAGADYICETSSRWSGTRSYRVTAQWLWLYIISVETNRRAGLSCVIRICSLSRDIMGYTFNSSIWKAESWESLRFPGNLIYKVNSRTTKAAVQRNHCLQKEKKKT